MKPWKHGLLPVLVLLLIGPGGAGAKTCFDPAFYKMMFKPVALKTEAGGHAALAAESDYLTATGKDPHAKAGEESHDELGHGCMCGINNGRFDLLIRNAATDAAGGLTPAFRIKNVRIDFQENGGSISEDPVTIDAGRLEACFSDTLSIEGRSAFDAPNGRSASPRILEPGEMIIGCVCLSPSDRRKSGKARIEVSYEPVVWMLDLTGRMESESMPDGGIRRSGRYDIQNLDAGESRIFRAILPPETAASDISDLRIFLTKSDSLEIFTRPADQGWSENIEDWRSGEWSVSTPKAGKTIFILVRSTGAAGSGVLAVDYRTAPDAPQPAGSATIETGEAAPAPHAVAPIAEKAFTAHIRSVAGGSNIAPTVSRCCPETE